MEGDIELSGYEGAVLIGQGGLGRVYRARRVSTGGLVAIKELLDVAQGSKAWHRARREVEALVRVKGHPSIVSVEEIVQGPRGPCLVMEYLAGGSLAERVDQGALPFPEIVLIGQQTLAALADAHAVGVIHRDVKPHNILVGSFGQVKVCDFGISALVRGEAQTQTGSLTLAYASPEELDRQRVGPPADVYSFCATVRHLLTGHRPTFAGRSQPVAHLDPSPLGSLAARLDTDLLRGMSQEPGDRPTISALRDAFDAAAVRLGPAALRSLSSESTTDTQVSNDMRISTGQPTAPVVSAAPPPVGRRAPDPVAVPPIGSRGSGSRAALLVGVGVAALFLAGAGFFVLNKGDEPGDSRRDTARPTASTEQGEAPVVEIAPTTILTPVDELVLVDTDVIGADGGVEGNVGDFCGELVDVESMGDDVDVDPIAVIVSLDQLSSTVPGEIRADFDVFAAAVQRVALGQSEGSDEIATEIYMTATANLDAFVEANCPDLGANVFSG